MRAVPGDRHPPGQVQPLPGAAQRRAAIRGEQRDVVVHRRRTFDVGRRVRRVSVPGVPGVVDARAIRPGAVTTVLHDAHDAVRRGTGDEPARGGESQRHVVLFDREQLRGVRPHRIVGR